MNSSKIKIMKKVVVTGGAGLIGSTVVEMLVQEKDIREIIILDNFVRGTTENVKSFIKNKKVKIIKGDIRDIKTVEKALKGAYWVVHEAAIKNILCDEDPRLALEVLIDGTFNIMEACVKFKVKKLVFNSSASVYGQPLKLPMSEKDSLNNEAFYGAGKIATEELAKAFHKMYGLNYICLRPFNVYGPKMDVSGIYTEVFIRWLDNIDKGESPVIFGDGKNTLDFVYIKDVADATIKALKSNRTEGIYNVASGKETDLNTLVLLLLKLTKSKLKPIHKKSVRKSNYVTRRRADIAKAKKELGFVSKTSLESGLMGLIEWRRNIKTK